LDYVIIPSAKPYGKIPIITTRDLQAKLSMLENKQTFAQINKRLTNWWFPDHKERPTAESAVREAMENL
jgi:hypothetical protein